MAKTRIEGTCHLCGSVGPLSFEHVPPKKAFNHHPVLEQPLGEAMERDFDASPRGTVNQRGAGGYTLCESCNNKTGHWYGSSFVAWCYQGRDVLVRSNYAPKLIYLHYVYPLRILKQIYTMAFSVNSASWRKRHPALEQFVLDPQRKWLNPDNRVFVHYNIEGSYRTVGNGVAILRLNKSSKPLQVTEISFPPFGYVITTDGTDPDERLCEITHFRRYGFDEAEVAPLYLPVLPTILPIPLDYRTRKEIDQQAAESQAVADRLGMGRLKQLS